MTKLLPREEASIWHCFAVDLDVLGISRPSQSPTSAGACWHGLAYIFSLGFTLEVTGSTRDWRQLAHMGDTRVCLYAVIRQRWKRVIYCLEKSPNKALTTDMMQLMHLCCTSLSSNQSNLGLPQNEPLNWDKLHISMIPCNPALNSARNSFKEYSELVWYRQFSVSNFSGENTYKS